MRILAIDPGYQRLGIAVLEKAARGKEVLVYSSCFETESSTSHGERLAEIGKEVARVIGEYGPKACAIESLFFSTNAKTATKVAEVRGVILYEAAKAGLSIHEYNPMEVKVAVTGYGKSDKDQVTFMTKKILGVEKDALDDEYDAMAIGITCFATERF